MVREAGDGEGRYEIPVLSFGVLPHGERRDAAESRRRVLDTARELFEERGVDSVSMHEIGRAAGVGQGTLYRRYEHKGALCSALLFESTERFYERVRARTQKGNDAALVQLGSLIDDLAAFNEENAPLLGAVRDAAGGERRMEMYRNPFYGWLRATVIVLLEQAIAEGEAAPDLDVEYAADFVLAPLNIDLYLFQRHELGMEPVRITSVLRGLLLYGLQARKSTNDV
jgi:AcrR family transcriptional regulator